MMTFTLDVKDLSCPLPVLKANRQVKEMMAGDTLEILATDPGAPLDFKAFCETTGHKLLECTEESGVYTIRIEILEKQMS
ncbi:sulfurtransferase TusA family protein [Varunaivibrio sulfuroxidans]|uniref:tRNA 2-thiouridine synthesizing protein A n=1 Tax=Varunaivibrio sulfuroxidans TaxID=1773489 RepID=A0A4R3J4X9_9PROT|nr:sulfurtransferase TusA family protein [Varunaivibrio sulfuroxidans]TCS60355.1 tRNA 2-thiouridine synthesizing protein A [Varunaivibrio sulfuroxidans]WES30957.1 sulfurtransferase TusA family protein [Varunaivibrio sulfuroxidans]